MLCGFLASKACDEEEAISGSHADHMRGSWCHLWSICVGSHGWKVPFLAPAFPGHPSVIWLNTNVYLPFQFKQLQPIAQEENCLMWQKAEKKKRVSAVLQSLITTLYILLLQSCANKKKSGGKAPPPLCIIVGILHKGKLHSCPLSESWATNSCQ